VTDSPLSVTAPYFFTARTCMVIRLHDPSLIRSSEHFVKVDLYPTSAPSTLGRHYGHWDIPCRLLTTAETSIRVDWPRRTLVVEGPGGLTDIEPTWAGRLDEAGYAELHVSLYAIRDPRRPRQTASQSIFLRHRGLGTDLKQLNVPVTDRCNLACVMCPRQNTKDLVEADIDDDVLRPLLEAVPTVSCVLLQGLGEPLLYPGIVDLVEQVKGLLPPGGQVGLTTNGTLLDGPLAERLLGAGIDFVYFSVDAASEAVYRKIRRGADFRSVHANIGRAVALRDQAGAATTFMMNFVLQAANLSDVGPFTRLAGDLGVDSVTYSYCLGSDTGVLTTFPEDALSAAFAEAARWAEHGGVDVGYPPLRPSTAERCSFMERAVLTRTGDVLPCHAMAPGYRSPDRAVSFGNVSRQPLTEIWTSAGFARFREAVLSGAFPEVCENCSCKAYLVP